MLTIQLTDEDIIRLRMIDVDQDGAAALAFVRERLLAEVRRQEGMKMRSHLDGGRSSVL
jgi:hypothetical protein